VKLVLDTCSFIWLTDKPEKLSTPAKQAIGDKNCNLLLSDITIWEMCIKWQSGKLSLNKPPSVWIPEQKQIWKLGTIAIKPDHLFHTAQLPQHHRDPFDRLLVAQCLAEKAAILTPDTNIHAYPIEAIW
jgi:PIN domain nuclease of toxin-antitoxin system